jgi:hypothetical protein
MSKVTLHNAGFPSIAHQVRGSRAALRSVEAQVKSVGDALIQSVSGSQVLRACSASRSMLTMPSSFGFVGGMIKAQSDLAFPRLVERFIAFYHENLFDPHWGEQVKLGPDNTLEISM